MLREELLHILLSIFAGFVAYRYYKNWRVFLISVLAGVFIDVDHIIDYLIFTRLRSFNITEMSSGEFFAQSDKVFVFFHGFEYAIIFILLFLFAKQIFRVEKSKLMKIQGVLLALGLSLFLHLVFDTIHNKPVWPTYFISYRIAHNFNHDDFKFPKCEDTK